MLASSFFFLAVTQYFNQVVFGGVSRRFHGDYIIFKILISELRLAINATGHIPVAPPDEQDIITF